MFFMNIEEIENLVFDMLKLSKSLQTEIKFQLFAALYNLFVGSSNNISHSNLIWQIIEILSRSVKILKVSTYQKQDFQSPLCS
jgi:hypothetical protein